MEQASISKSIKVNLNYHVFFVVFFFASNLTFKADHTIPEEEVHSKIVFIDNLENSYLTNSLIRVNNYIFDFARKKKSMLERVKEKSCIFSKVKTNISRILGSYMLLTSFYS